MIAPDPTPATVGRAPAASADRALPPADEYRARCARFQAERDRLERPLRWVGYGRLATFALLAVLVVWALVSGLPGLLLVAAAAGVVFVGLILYSERLSQAQHRFRA